ncbi:MAG: 2'-5' RNA ligase family protein [Anaerolineae bacterium]|nr:2'-5' RNA ligase family protein [Anaerolineae bacterium]
MANQTTRSVADRTRYALVIRVPREIENKIEDLFLGLAGTTKPVMGYHITLLGPFALKPGIDGSEALGDIQRVCRRHEPFEIRLAGLEASREPDSNAVYLGVLDAHRSTALHADLLDLLSRHIEFADERSEVRNTEQFRPHVTLALGLTDKALSTFPLESLEHRCRSAFSADEIWLVTQEPDEPWQHVRSFPLGASAGQGLTASPRGRSRGDPSPY